MSIRHYLIPTTTQQQLEGAMFAIMCPMQTVFNGYGSVTYNGNTLGMIPAISTDPNVTHAALVRSILQMPIGHYAVSWRGKTTRQVRSGSPANPWETLWFVWDYIDPQHFTYLVVKPNGWEVGRRDTGPSSKGGQIFLKTEDATIDMIGRTISVDVRRDLNEVEIVADFTDNAWPRLHLDVKLDIPFKYSDGITSDTCCTAVYTEDAAVQVTGWAIRS